MSYEPEQDSYLLEKEVKNYIKNLKNKNIKVLDMGSGSGIQALGAISSGIIKESILCVDIDKKVVEELKKQKLNAIQSNLFSNIKANFDLILFNPPYLPEDKYDKGLDTTAGKKGYELIVKFLKQAKSHLKEKGAILLLISSLSKPSIIKKEARKLNYKIEKLSEEKLFFERLEVWKLNI